MMSSSLRSRLAAGLALCLLPVATAFSGDRPAPVGGDLVAPRLPHPHFTKTVNCELSKDLSITLKHLTVTFDKAGAKKMPAGQAWHLGGATFASTGDLLVGGHKVKAGAYALSARKTDKGWQLTLHDGPGFSRPGEGAVVLQTEFVDKTLLFEHLNCDIQPSGDKKITKLFLDVRFDTMLARVLIEIPE